MTASRWLLRARTLIVLASVLLIAAVPAVWARAQILDTSGWTRTSVQLLRNDQVRETLADTLSERLLSALDAEALAKKALPSSLSSLAGLLSGAASQRLPATIDRALLTPTIQKLWEQANRHTHAEVIALLDGGNAAVSTAQGVVTIDLTLLLDRLGERIGVGGSVADLIPPAQRRLVLFRSRQLRVAQNGVKGLRDLSIVLPLLALLGYLLALWLAPARRPRALVEVGAGILLAAALALALRGWLDSYVVRQLAHGDRLRPAVHEVAAILTDGWRSRALWLGAGGVVVLLAGLAAAAGGPLLAAGRRPAGPRLQPPN